MNNIKEKLEDIISNLLIPESEAYLEELHKLLENNIAKEDDLNIIKDMESFLVELENILLAIKENKITDTQASEIYEKVSKMIEESK